LLHACIQDIQVLLLTEARKEPWAFIISFNCKSSTLGADRSSLFVGEANNPVSNGFFLNSGFAHNGTVEAS